MRGSGILLPVFSLPSNYGIGSFSDSAYRFIDQLKIAGQKYWQILPIGPTGYGDSPYQSFSTFAGNPYFIDLDKLIEEGLLSKKECQDMDYGDNIRYIDYEKIYLSRFPILRKAYSRSNYEGKAEYISFQKENEDWLEDYALYMAIKDSYGGLSWVQWEENLKYRDKKTLELYGRKLGKDIGFYKFIQYVFSKQWAEIKSYANNNGIKIIGDIPIYVAFDSADTWSHPELFQLDDDLNPIAVAGCPPDGFAEDGQLWGNPLYNWEVHKESNYAWWIKRIHMSFKWYDKLRVDHFKGFDEYFSIPYGEATARNGKWMKGPGIGLFQEIEKQLGKLDIIAEDLGYITESVRELLKETGFPGMKVLEFAFDSREESDYLPHNYNNNSVVYTGTHDNETLKAWFETIPNEDRRFALSYINRNEETAERVTWDMICLAQQSVADLCIIPIQDYLCLGKEARINTPSTVGLNWKWRLLEEDIKEDLLLRIQSVTKTYGRL